LQTSQYYREQAARARRWAREISPNEAVETLTRAARDFDDIAVDLENGAVEIVHPNRMPQRQHIG